MNINTNIQIYKYTPYISIHVIVQRAKPDRSMPLASRSAGCFGLPQALGHLLAFTRLETAGFSVTYISRLCANCIHCIIVIQLNWGTRQTRPVDRVNAQSAVESASDIAPANPERAFASPSQFPVLVWFLAPGLT
jgi:hypothetical protein